MPIPDDFKPKPKRDEAWTYARIHSDETRRLSKTTLWDLYSTGYKRAGDLLIENVGSYPDFLIYPIVFLYRHYIELRLKQIIYEGNKLLGEPERTPDYIFRMHDLNQLWRDCEEVLKRVFPEDSPRELAEIKDLIGKFSEIDSSSYTFRYPVNTEGDPMHPTDRNIDVSLIALSEVMDKLFPFFDGSAQCIADMPSHGCFFPGQPQMNESQINELFDLINNSEKNWYFDDISRLIKEKYNLDYSPEQVITTFGKYGKLNLGFGRM